MRQIGRTALLIVTATRILPAPHSQCTCELEIDCSHEVVLAICLKFMQESDSYTSYAENVPTFDKDRAPSGKPVWWADIFRSGVGGRQTKEAKRRASLTVDERVRAGYEAWTDEVCSNTV